MGEQRLTEVTKSPAARVATVIGLFAAGLALVMTVGMVIVALGGYSSEVLQMCLLIWVLSLTTVFVVTRYLKNLAAAQEPDEGTSPGQ
ncbi:MAG: hypothetical protein WA988_19760 [Candidatus Nanopelagicales bacterium]